ncbi:CBASS cGAMP-activated phospholipase [Citrobacter freundii]
MSELNAVNEYGVRILSLNGGGARGMFTISLLAEFERILALKQPDQDIKIGDYFDLITGTSIGGILALGLAKGKSARELERVFYDKANDIFPKRWWLFNLLKSLVAPIYSSTPLRQTIEMMIGDETTFNDLTRRVMIPAVNLSTGKPQFFKTPHNPDFTRDGPLKLIDAALATSAAPTFFAPHRSEDLGAYFADGGLVANNPSYIGLLEVFQDMKSDFPDVTHKDIHILNIGTTGEEYSLREGANKQVISSQADSLVKISRIWADFFPQTHRISLFRLFFPPFLALFPVFTEISPTDVSFGPPRTGWPG